MAKLASTFACGWSPSFPPVQGKEFSQRVSYAGLIKREDELIANCLSGRESELSNHRVLGMGKGLEMGFLVLESLGSTCGCLVLEISCQSGGGGQANLKMCGL